MRRARVLLALATTAALVGLALAPTAQAAFPGDNGKIAFTRLQSDGSTDVYVVNPDGTGLTNLTPNTPGWDDEQPAWSADGSKIAFASDRTDSFEIWVMDADGSNPTQVTDNPGTFDWEPSWSPDGTKLVFRRENGPSGLWIWNFATSAQSAAIDPGWSPDWNPAGNWIVFEAYYPSLDSAELFTFVPGAPGSAFQLTDNTRAEDSPDWSPAGDTVVFTQFDFDGSLQVNNELWTVRSDGVGLSLLYDQEDAFDPTFSPDGTKVAFQQNGDIVWIPATGGSPTTIVGGSTWDYDPDWGVIVPEVLGDEGLIAFTSTRDGNPEIYVMNPDGSAPTRLTNHSAPDDYAAISPDGTEVAFTSWRDGDAEIYIVDVTGADPAPTKVTDNTGYDAEPTWSPDGAAVMYVSDRGGSSRLWFTMVDDGTTFGPYGAPSPASDFSPDWSALGVAYASDQDGDNELYTFIPEGTVEMPLTSNPQSDYGPAWAPESADATFHNVMFVRGKPGEGDLYQIAMQEIPVPGDPVPTSYQVTDTAAWEFSPTWRGDATFIAFSRATPGDLDSAEIWLMDQEGQESQLTSTIGANYNPHWGRCTLDGDGLCSQVPTPVPTTHTRSITLSLDGHLVAAGKVKCPDRVAGCVDGVKVQIQRKARSGWKNVRSTFTDGQGAYTQTLPDQPGTYRAVAKVLTVGGETCLKATSSGVRHKH